MLVSSWLRRTGYPGAVRRVVAIVMSAVLLAAVGGCGLLGGSSGSSPGTSADGAGKVEKSRVRVGTMVAVDVAPLHLAVKNGYFRDEGLELELVTLQGGAQAIPSLVGGDLDFSFGNWVSFFAAQATGTVDLRFVANGFAGKPNVFVVLSLAGSGISGPKDLMGKKVAVNTRSNVAELSIGAVLRDQGLDPGRITYLEMPFPNMLGELQKTGVDAVAIIEPFITKSRRSANVVTVLDAMSGPSAELPIAGYATTAGFAKDKPKTVAAFRRALAKGQQAAADRSQVDAVLPEYAKIDKDTAAAVQLGAFPASLEPAQLQRVADLMRTAGLLGQRLDVAPLILPSG